MSLQIPSLIASVSLLAAAIVLLRSAARRLIPVID
jgi:hypothetical protein